MLFVLFVFGFRQGQEFLENREYNLVPIRENRVPPGIITENGMRCGKYFYMNSKDPDQKPVPFIYMEFTSYGQFLLGAPNGPIFMGRSTFIPIIDEEKVLAPTIRWVSTLSEGLPDPFSVRLVIRISSKDLKEAKPCLCDPL